MKRFICVLVFLTFSAGLFVAPVPVEAAAAHLPITAGSALLIDAESQKIIYAKSPHSKRPPASTTKLMTALVVLDRMKANEVVTIPAWVRSIEPSKAYLRHGERYLVRDLLHATLISSANDAAEVLAVAAAGSRAEFASWMNAKARSLGAKNTRFTNASGLPFGTQYSTAYDLALIMAEARRHPFIVDSLGRRYHAIQSVNGRTIWLKNHNRLLWRDANSVIGKTGYTRKGRYCFVGRVWWGGREVFVSMLGSRRLWNDLKILVDYQFGVSPHKVHQNRKLWSRQDTRKIQRALQAAGSSPGTADGRFGPRTVRAVEQFQRKHQLPADGVVGSETCQALTRYGLSKNTC